MMLLLGFVHHCRNSSREKPHSMSGELARTTWITTSSLSHQILVNKIPESTSRGHSHNRGQETFSILVNTLIDFYIPLDKILKNGKRKCQN